MDVENLIPLVRIVSNDLYNQNQSKYSNVIRNLIPNHIIILVLCFITNLKLNLITGGHYTQ